MTMLQSSRAERAARLVGIVALALVLGALGFQYIRHLAPCEMCHWQRWPHIAAAAIGLVGVSVYRKQPGLGATMTIIIVAGLGLAIVTIVLVAISGLIAAYQTGMQSGFLPGPQGCTVEHAYVLGSGAPPPAVSCNVVTWSLFGLSLAEYNAIFSLLIAGTGAVLLSRKHAA